MFASALWTDPRNSALRNDYQSVGAQVDLRFSVLHWYEMTLSVGYAVGFQGTHRARRRVDGFAEDPVVAVPPDRPARAQSDCCRCWRSSPRCSTSTATSSSAAHRHRDRRGGRGRRVVCYFVNGYLLGAVAIDFTTYSRYVGPAVEELAKALVIVALIRAHRIGFLVDAAIAGFAVGTGFAIVENLLLSAARAEAGLGTWIVRGFGTAIMHGGTTAIFAVLSLSLHRARPGPVARRVPARVRAGGSAALRRSTT